MNNDTRKLSSPYTAQCTQSIHDTSVINGKVG